MEEIILTALDRDTKNRKFREPGYVAGVIYGDGVEGSVPVKFSESNLLKVIAKHGSHSKVNVLYGNANKIGFLKEVQRNPVTQAVIHVDMQVVSSTHEIKVLLPIIFKGKEQLFNKQLRLQTHKSEIEVQGRIDAMPDAAEVDVSGKELGDSVTTADFVFGSGIRIVDKDTESYGNIVHLHALAAEPEAAAEGTEAAAAAVTPGESDKSDKADKSEKPGKE